MNRRAKRLNLKRPVVACLYRHFTLVFNAARLDSDATPRINVYGHALDGDFDVTFHVRGSPYLLEMPIRAVVFGRERPARDCLVANP